MSKLPATIVLEFRGDIRDLAEIIQFYRENGRHIPHRSELIRQIVADFAHLIREKRNGLPPFTYEESGRIVRSAFPDPHKRGGKPSYLKALALEDQELDRGIDLEFPSKEQVDAATKKVRTLVEEEEHGQHS